MIFRNPTEITRICRFCILLAALGGRLLAGDVSVPARVRIPDRVFDAGKLGVTPNATNPVTDRLQAAIDTVAHAGGGHLILAAGVYEVGPIRLASKLDLKLSAGTVIRLIPLGTDFPVAEGRCLNFLSGADLHDVMISGPGVIDGQGAAWWKAFRAKKLTTGRPQMIYLNNCERVELNGFKIINPPNTHISLCLCQEIVIEGIDLEAPGDSPNTDGINLSGRDCLIEHSRVSTGDDNIVILTHAGRGWEPPMCRNIVIRDCELGEGHGLSIGSYTRGGVANVLAEHIKFTNTTSGIRLKAGRDRGGLVENLTYRDITMDNVKYPIYVTSYYPRPPKTPADDAGQGFSPLTPRWQNILIERLTARNAQTPLILWGLPEMPIGRVTLNDVSIDSEHGAKIYNAPDVVLRNVSLHSASDEPADHWPATNQR